MGEHEQVPEGRPTGEPSSAPGAPETPAKPPPAPAPAERGGLTVPPKTGNPLLWVWIRPRGVTRATLEKPRRRTRWLYAVPCLASAFQAVMLGLLFQEAIDVPVWLVVAVCVVGGALLALAGIVFSTMLQRLVGRLFGSRALPWELRRAACLAATPGLAHAVISNAPALFVWAVWEPFSVLPTWMRLLQAVAGLLSVTAFVWGLFVWNQALAEAHRFAWWRSLLNTLSISVALLVVGLAVLIVLVPLV